MSAPAKMEYTFVSKMGTIVEEQVERILELEEQVEKMKQAFNNIIYVVALNAPLRIHREDVPVNIAFGTILTIAEEFVDAK